MMHHFIALLTAVAIAGTCSYYFCKSYFGQPDAPLLDAPVPPAPVPVRLPEDQAASIASGALRVARSRKEFLRERDTKQFLEKIKRLRLSICEFETRYPEHADALRELAKAKLASPTGFEFDHIFDLDLANEKKDAESRQKILEAFRKIVLRKADEFQEKDKRNSPMTYNETSLSKNISWIFEKSENSEAHEFPEWLKPVIYNTANAKIDSMKKSLMIPIKPKTKRPAHRSHLKDPEYFFHMGTYFFRHPITQLGERGWITDDEPGLAFTSLCDAFRPWLTRPELEEYVKYGAFPFGV